jgi:hypothetical protein
MNRIHGLILITVVMEVICTFQQAVALCTMYNGELHTLYSSPDIIMQIKSRRMRWVGHVARMGEERNVYRVLMGKPKGKRPSERPRHRWEDGIKMDLREIGWGCGVDSPGSGYGSLVGYCECGDEPLGSGTMESVS